MHRGPQAGKKSKARKQSSRRADALFSTTHLQPHMPLALPTVEVPKQTPERREEILRWVSPSVIHWEVLKLLIN